ncbi:hypothetical protein C8R44DRAFT_724167 [Mycena epipterygia]|nr:hypothetical protein C8R44DRAFT_724167 [Mycena epipterygia]
MSAGEVPLGTKPSSRSPARAAHDWHALLGCGIPRRRNAAAVVGPPDGQHQDGARPRHIWHAVDESAERVGQGGAVLRQRPLYYARLDCTLSGRAVDELLPEKKPSPLIVCYQVTRSMRLSGCRFSFFLDTRMSVVATLGFLGVGSFEFGRYIHNNDIGRVVSRFGSLSHIESIHWCLHEYGPHSILRTVELYHHVRSTVIDGKSTAINVQWLSHIGDLGPGRYRFRYDSFFFPPFAWQHRVAAILALSLGLFIFRRRRRKIASQDFFRAWIGISPDTGIPSTVPPEKGTTPQRALTCSNARRQQYISYEVDTAREKVAQLKEISTLPHSALRALPRSPRTTNDTTLAAVSVLPVEGSSGTESTNNSSQISETNPSKASSAATST